MRFIQGHRYKTWIFLHTDSEVNMTYQIRAFTCNLCGISFTVEADSKIDEQKYCSECAIQRLNKTKKEKSK